MRDNKNVSIIKAWTPVASNVLGRVSSKTPAPEKPIDRTWLMFADLKSRGRLMLMPAAPSEAT
jgi:hypothetical protein